MGAAAAGGRGTQSLNSTGTSHQYADDIPERRYVLALTALLAVAFIVRAWHLGHSSIWYDEGVTIGVAHFTWPEFFHFAKVEPNSLFYYLLMRVVCFFGESEFYLRFTSVAFGVASIAVFALFAERVFSRSVALATAALLAFMPLHAVYSREIRGYALLLFLVGLAWFSVERCLRDGRTRWFGLWSACWILAVYVHVFSAFALASQLLTLPFAREFYSRKRQFLRALGCVAIGYSPTIWLTLGSHRQQLFWVPPLNLKLVKIFFSEYFGGGVLIVASVVLLATCFLFCSTLLGPDRQAERWPWAVAVFGTTIPIALLAALSVFQPAFIARYALQSQPIFALALAAVVCRCQRVPMIVALVTLIALNVPALINMDRTPPWEDQRNDYRSAVQYIASLAAPGDVIAVWGPYSRFGLEYYQRRLNVSEFPRLAYPPPERSRADDTFALRPVVEQLDAISRNHRRIWLFLDVDRPYKELSVYPHFFLRRFGIGHRLASETHFRDATVYMFEAE